MQEWPPASSSARSTWQGFNRCKWRSAATRIACKGRSGTWATLPTSIRSSSRRGAARRRLIDGDRLDDDVGRGVAEALGPERLNLGRVLVANPRGLVIVSYPPDVEQKELLRDLKRLLTGAD
jgi:hypothetical protein